MPVKSAKQYGMMTAIAGGAKPQSSIGPSQAVAKEMVHRTPSKKRSAFMKALKKRKT
jgi:hypothetical protein